VRRRIELFGFGVQIGMDVGWSRLAAPMSSDERGVIYAEQKPGSLLAGVLLRSVGRPTASWVGLGRDLLHLVDVNHFWAGCLAGLCVCGGSVG